MSVTLSFYAFEPGAPGVPAASATGVYVSALVSLLRGHTDQLDVRLRWLRPAQRRFPSPLSEGVAAVRWVAGELGRVLADRSRYLLFFYPKLPVLAHLNQPTLLSLAHRGYQMLHVKTKLTRQRIVVIIEDLPIEMTEGTAIAGGPRPELDIPRVRAIERTLLRAAHLIVTPPGYIETIRKQHGIDPDRFRTFRRNIYLPSLQTDQIPDIQFEAGEVNFLYSGAIDATMASNFREMLRAIRSAPRARLHVCGPGRDAAERWFAELDVPNARHYGRLGLAAHDWLARRCDAGLILWPSDNPYFQLTPTSKYSAYVANGLAVLSTDLRAVAENIQRDGVGQAMPIKELSVELLRWASRPNLFAGHKQRAREHEADLCSGAEMKGWIEEIAQGG